MIREIKDRTSSPAISHAEREQRQMAGLALTIRAGRCNPAWSEEKRKAFTGIYRRLLTDPIEEVKRVAGER